MDRVLDGGEEADYDGGLYAEFRSFLELMKVAAVAEVIVKREELTQNSFDPMI